MLRPKKNSYKEFDNKKKIPAAPKLPTPSHNFSNGPSLRTQNTIEDTIHRGYYTVARGYEFCFREAKQYFKNERSK